MSSDSRPASVYIVPKLQLVAFPSSRYSDTTSFPKPTTQATRLGVMGMLFV
jgi:hypothetical protein